MKKRFASAGLAAGLLAGGGAGLALGVTSISSATSSPSVNVVDDPAATDPATDSTTDPATTDPATTDATDETTGADEPADRPDRGAWLQEALQPLVADGTITQAQADAVTAALQDARPEGRPGRPGMGRGMGHGMGHGRIGHGLEVAATALGMTTDELRAALEDGQTIAEVAADKGVDVQTVIDAIAAELKSHLDEEVAAGEHTQDEADAKLADAIERITERITERLGDAQGS